MIRQEMFQAVVAAAVATASFLFAQLETNVPIWIKDYGLPLVMLAGTIWALIAICKELSRERMARIVDRDKFIDMMRIDITASNVAREKLLIATIEQTNEFKSLRRALIRSGNLPDHADQ